MAFCSYKCKLMSADGATFIRTIKLSVPVAIADGEGAGLYNWVLDNGTGFNRIFDSVVEGGTHTWFPSPDVTILGNPNFSYVLDASVAFGVVVTNAFALSNGLDCRLVFNNGSFIYLKADTSSGATCFSFYYCLEGTVNPTSSYIARVDSDSTFKYSGSQSVPMPIFNENGTFTDWTLRGMHYVFNKSQSGPYMVSLGQHLQRWSNVNMSDWYNGIIPVDDNEPYPEIPSSGPSGPSEGVGLPTSDEIEIPGLPTFSVTDTGFVTLFNPTMTQVKNLADYMWNGLFDINNFKKIFADPMDCILGFNMVPVAVPSGAAANINIGNLVTSVTMNVATSQWVEVDCGSIDIGLPYGSYLDFSPYTKFSIYLPYIGTCELSADDVAGEVLTLKYHVDALSCACVAYLKCGNHVLYQWTGSCGYSIPVTQNDFSRMIMAIANIAAAGIGGAVVGGAGAAIMNAGAAAAKNVSALKPEVHRSGAIGSSAGLMGEQTPYLIIEIPQACKPEKQYHYTGYPGFITVTVGDLTGYAEFEEIILSGIGCTEEERSMIESLCKGGIYV